MKWLLRAAVAAAIVGALWGLSYVLHEHVIEYVVRIAMLCGMNIILAVGLNLINGTTGQFSIGHAGFMAVGAYTTAYVCTQLAPEVAGVLGTGFLPDAVVFNVGLIAGAALAAATGVVVGVPSLRLKGDYLAIVTLGFGEIIRLLLTNAEFLGGATGFSGDNPTGLSPYTNVFWVFLWVVIVIVVIRNVTFSQTGRSLEAISEDEIAAEAMGTPTTRLKVVAFTLSAAAAGIAGGLFAHLQGSVRPDDFKFDRSIDMIVMIIVGGLGSITGAVIGGIFVGVTLELMRDLSEYRLVLYSLLLVIIMLVRPQGVLGKRELSFSRLFPKKAAKPARAAGDEKP
ncbi:MAG: branched-chain amino acid ABC transporter permease [Deltaproteobacteria bacterium]|nr:branched-chain amino acid ABC transporter permease [Deltaproteobacteria bacterium]